MLTFFTNEKVLLRQAISELQADDAPGNMREAILLALSFTQGMSTQEIVVIGDGAYRGMTRPMCRASSCGISKLLAENGMSGLCAWRFGSCLALRSNTRCLWR